MALARAASHVPPGRPLPGFLVASTPPGLGQCADDAGHAVLDIAGIGRDAERRRGPKPFARLAEPET